MYKEENRAVHELNKLNLTLLTDIAIDRTKKTITIAPEYKSIGIEYKVDMNGTHKLEATIPDFDNSHELYELTRGKKSPFIILEDKYSSKRGAVMIEFLETIETDLRSIYLSESGREFDINVKGSNHPISETSLSVIIFDLLLSPAEDWFFIKKIKEAHEDDEIASARKLTLIDQLDLPYTKDELEGFVEARNSVMHFKVVTVEDTGKIINILEKMHGYQYNRILRKILKNHSDSTKLVI